MSSRSGSVPFGFLVFAGLASAIQAYVTGEPARVPGSGAVVETAARSADDPGLRKLRYATGVSLVEEFLRTGKGTVLTDSTNTAAQGDTFTAAKADSPAAGCFPTVGTLIATLPDPTDSHLDWAFDSDYEAIVRAYERAGYVVDRFWLPWTEKLDTMVALTGVDAGRRVRHIYPGVVLFRRDDSAPFVVARPVAPAGKDAPAVTAEQLERAKKGALSSPRTGPAATSATDSTAKPPGARIGTPECLAPGAPPPRPDLHLLYIVGETPTGGVHKDAFDKALRDRDAVLSRAGADAAELRIVGPSFSGSARSIAMVLDTWRAADASHHSHPRRTRVITGSATSGANAEILRWPGSRADSPVRASAGTGSGDGASGGSAGYTVEFSATVHSDTVLTQTLLYRVLCPLGVHEDQVAILRESGTAYGRDVSTSAGEVTTCENGRTLRPDRFVQIAFPMNVGSVRAEFDTRTAQERAEAASGRTRGRTRITLRDPDRPGDRPPPSSQLTVPTLELLLDEIERTVTSHRIRVVGILASDVRDKLFLAEELRRRVRDVQLFTFEENTLFLAPENNRALRGMLVISTYSLALQSQWWTRGHLGGSRLSFANDGALGIHNAVLMQLGSGSLVASYASPFSDYPSARQRVPPVWVSVVGRDAMVPVTIRGIREDGFTRIVNGPAPRPREWPSLEFFTVVCIAMLGGVLLYALRGLLPTRATAQVERVRLPPGNPRRRVVYGWARALLGRPPRRAGAPSRTRRQARLRLAAWAMRWFRRRRQAERARAERVRLSTGNPRRVVYGWARAVLERRSRRAGAPPRTRLRLAAWVMPWLLRRRRAVRARAGAPPPAPALPLTGEHQVLLDEVRWASQNFHAYAYLWLRGLGLMSVFVPVAVITTFALLRVPPSQGPGGGSRVLVVMFLAVVLVLAVWSLARYFAGGLRRLREVRTLGIFFALFGWGSRRGRHSWWVEVVLRGVLFGGGVLLFGLSLALTGQIVAMRWHKPVTFRLFLARAADFDNGVSPLLPLLLLSAGYAAWCTWHAWRIEALGVTTPYECAYDRPVERRGATAPTALPADAAEHVHEVRMRLFKVVPDDTGVFVLGGIAVLSLALGLQIGHTLEGMIGLTMFDWLLGLSVTASLVGICWAVYRLLAVWVALHRVLREVGETPLLPAFRRLPESIGSLTRLTLWRSPSRKVVNTVAATQWRHMKQLEKAASADLTRLDVDDLSLSSEVKVYTAAPGPPASRFPRRLSSGRQESSFADLSRILSAMWAAEPDGEIVDEIKDDLRKSPNESTGSLFRRAFPGRVRLWLRAAEEFAAVQVVDYVEWVLHQLRMLTLFLFISLLMTTALLSSYPFQPQSIAKMAFFAVLLVAVGAVLYVMTALNRDPVLSLVAGTDPGRVSMDRSFLVNAFAVAVVPIVTLIGSEVPALNVFTWLPPLLHALGGG